MKLFKRLGSFFHTRGGAYLFYALAAVAAALFAGADYAHSWMIDLYGELFPPIFAGVIALIALLGFIFLIITAAKCKTAAYKIIHTIVCVLSGVLFVYSLIVAFSLDSGFHADAFKRGFGALLRYLPYLLAALIVPIPFAAFKMKTAGKIYGAVGAAVPVVLAVFVGIICLGLPVKPAEKGWSNDNNGYDINSPEVERLIAARPSEIQLGMADLGYYSFIHYGMNTFTGREWGTGEEDPAEFCPTVVDTDQWVRTLKESGSKGVIFTAKHHDGFCLFPSAYTEHDIENSPYMDGKGDICKQMAESCKKYDMKLGFYLSPWDMHEETYATDAYNDFFVNQLTELCTNYGELFTIWFDGARGEDVGDWKYDFQRYYDVIRELQPNCAISLTGPDIRWIGNEAGIVRDSEWAVIPAGQASIEATMEQSQHGEDDALRLQRLQKNALKNNGSRELCEFYPDIIWKQAEADVSIHRGWFYTDEGNAAIQRSAKELEQIYYRTVGGNALLLMNVPPTKDGVIADKDIALLNDFKSRIDKTFANKLNPTTEAVTADGAAKAIDISNLDCSYKLAEGENAIRMKFDEKHKVSAITIREDITQSQRVEEFKIYAKTAAGYLKIYEGTVIGSEKICLINPLLMKNTDEILIVFTQSRSNPVIRTAEAFEK